MNKMWENVINHELISSEELAEKLTKIGICKIFITTRYYGKNRFNVDSKTAALVADLDSIEDFDRCWNRPYKCLACGDIPSGCSIENLLLFAKVIWNPAYTIWRPERYESKIRYGRMTPNGIYNPKNKYILDNIPEEIDLSSYPKISSWDMHALNSYTGYVPKIIVRNFTFSKVRCLCDELIIPECIYADNYGDEFIDLVRDFLSEANVRFIEIRIVIDDRKCITELEFEKTNLELYNIIVNRKSVRIPGLDAAMKSGKVKKACH